MSSGGSSISPSGGGLTQKFLWKLPRKEKFCLKMASQGKILSKNGPAGKNFAQKWPRRANFCSKIASQGEILSKNGPAWWNLIQKWPRRGKFWSKTGLFQKRGKKGAEGLSGQKTGKIFKNGAFAPFSRYYGNPGSNGCFCGSMAIISLLTAAALALIKFLKT